MNISTIIYLISILNFLVQASHLCVEEVEQNQECKDCMANSKLEQGTCNCLDGYISDNKVNKCYSCLPNCKKCNAFKLNQCEECFGQNADQENQCMCKEGFIYSSQMETCINKNEDLNLKHLQYQIQQNDFEKIKFDFCSEVEEQAQTSHLYSLTINNDNATFQLPFTKLNNYSSVAYIQTEQSLLFENILLWKIKSRPVLRDFNETIFEINYVQGLSQLDDTEDKYNLILMIEIKNLISKSYYYLLMKCGYQEQNLEKEKILEKNVDQVVDNYFTLFYQCPINCKLCSFNSTQSIMQCKKCINGMKLEQGKCFYQNQPTKIKEIKQIEGSEQNVECDIQTYEKNGYCELCDVRNCQICESQNSCKQCIEKYSLKDGRCECEKDQQCENTIQHCIYQNGNDCLQCEDGYYLNQKNCLKMLSNQYLLCIKEEKCYNCQNMESMIEKSKFQPSQQNCECQDGYFMNFRLLQCSQCDSSCKTCLDRSIKCTSCNDGFYLLEQKCKQCPQTCLKCDSTKQCNSCVDGYYLDQNRCKECMAQCAKCQTEKKCTQAIEGYYVDNQFNVNKCEIKNCKVCKDKQICQICNPHYFVEDGSCIECQEGCLSCEKNKESNQIKCFNCSSNYTLSDKDGNCQKCPQNCKLCATRNRCIQCQDGFKISEDKKTCECQNPNEYFRQNKCQICVDNCQVCESKDKCKDCQNYYENKNGLCKKKDCAIKKCHLCSTNDKCEQCQEGSYYFEDKKICGCKDNCETCTLNDEKKQLCSACKPKYYLKENKCEETNCEKESNDGKCEKCKIGYFINSNNQCEKCKNSNCKNCDDKNCIECDQGYYLLENECNKCTDKSCLNCQYDSTDDDQICLECIVGYDVKDNKCYKENNLFPLIALVFIISLIYGAFYFKEQLLSLCSNQNQGFVNSSDQDVELTNNQNKKDKQKREDDFNILED